MNKIKTIAIAGVIALFSSTTVMAASEQLYDKGRTYSSDLSGLGYNGYSTVVISASANYDPAQGWGRERIRAWSRLDTVGNIYPSPTYSNDVSQINIQFDANSTNGTALMMTATDPVTNTTSFTVPPFIYDILGYAGVQTNTIQAYVNSMTTSGTQVTAATAHDYTVAFNNPDYKIVDLPNTISYSNADSAVGTKYSGADAKFQYNLPSNITNLSVDARGKVKYYTLDNANMVYFYTWSGEAVLTHTVN